MKYIKNKVDNIVIDIVSAKGYFTEIEKQVIAGKSANMDLYNQYCVVYEKFVKSIQAIKELQEAIYEYYKGIE